MESGEIISSIADIANINAEIKAITDGLTSIAEQLKASAKEAAAFAVEIKKAGDTVAACAVAPMPMSTSYR
jgi:SepF-like predicted cell division protein (DUF552 family)